MNFFNKLTNFGTQTTTKCVFQIFFWIVAVFCCFFVNLNNEKKTIFKVGRQTYTVYILIGKNIYASQPSPLYTVCVCVCLIVRRHHYFCIHHYHPSLLSKKNILLWWYSVFVCKQNKIYNVHTQCVYLFATFTFFRCCCCCWLIDWNSEKRKTS